MQKKFGKLPKLCTGQIQGIPLNLLRYIGEDLDREGLANTPKRFLKAWESYTEGYGQSAEKLMTTFSDGANGYDEMVLVKDIPVYSHCEHHLAPFYGHVHIAYIPSGRILGLSKFARVVGIFMRRLQVQERLTSQIADAFVKGLDPVGVGVVMQCAHTCMISRGVKISEATTVTSAMRGSFKENSATRAEFMSLINAF